MRQALLVENEFILLHDEDSMNLKKILFETSKIFTCNFFIAFTSLTFKSSLSSIMIRKVVPDLFSHDHLVDSNFEPEKQCEEENEMFLQRCLIGDIDFTRDKFKVTQKASTLAELHLILFECKFTLYQ